MGVVVLRCGYEIQKEEDINEEIINLIIQSKSEMVHVAAWEQRRKKIAGANASEE